MFCIDCLFNSFVVIIFVLFLLFFILLLPVVIHEQQNNFPKKMSHINYFVLSIMRISSNNNFQKGLLFIFIFFVRAFFLYLLHTETGIFLPFRKMFNKRLKCLMWKIWCVCLCFFVCSQSTSSISNKWSSFIMIFSF